MSHLKLSLFLLFLSLAASQIIPQRAPLTLSVNKFQISSQQTCIYRGEGNIDIENGYNGSIKFFVVLFEQQANCNYKRCYYGYVQNYTVDDNGKENFVQGYGNQELTEQPIFKYEVNSIEDYKITHDKNLLFVFAQLIEITCQKVNPFFQEPPLIKIAQISQIRRAPTSNAQERKTSRFQRTSQNTQNEQDKEEPPKARYTFKREEQPQRQSSKNANRARDYGEKVAILKEPIIVKGLSTKQSFISEEIRLNDKNEVGLNEQKYEFDVQSDRDLNTSSKDEDSTEIQDLKGTVAFNVYLEEKGQISVIASSKIINQVNQKAEGRPKISFTKATLQLSRATRINFDVLDDEPIFEVSSIPSKFINPNPIFQNKKQPGDGDSTHFPGQKYTGVNVIQRFKDEKPPIFVGPTTIKANTRRNRLLQVIQTTTLVDSVRKIYQKTILGRTFRVDFRTKCELLEYSYDHKIRCRGWAIFNFLGFSKTVKVFDFTKSVSFTWKYSDVFTGSKGFKIWVGLPKPVDFIGFKFYINVKYRVDLDVEAKVINFNPYTLRVKADAVAKVTTDSSAGLKLAVVEGGVFIKGTLVRAKTDPQVRAIYKFAEQKVELKLKWWAQLWTFEAFWGFYWRRWRLFGGWTGKMIIKQWKIKSSFYKWKILEKTKIISI